MSASVEIPIEQPLAVEEVPGESDPEPILYHNQYNTMPTMPGTEYATDKFPLDPNEKLFEEDVPYVEPVTAGDGAIL
ncbi:hypothetical protein [Streptococcus sp. A18]|uniref:hypothetical protein n=1 Tax=Streptococcus sp. A18 TaxID=3373125 RepID=UPI00374D3AD9